VRLLAGTRAFGRGARGGGGGGAWGFPVPVMKGARGGGIFLGLPPDSSCFLGDLGAVVSGRGAEPRPGGTWGDPWGERPSVDPGGTEG